MVICAHLWKVLKSTSCQLPNALETFFSGAEVVFIRGSIPDRHILEPVLQVVEICQVTMLTKHPGKP